MPGSGWVVSTVYSMQNGGRLRVESGWAVAGSNLRKSNYLTLVKVSTQHLLTLVYAVRGCKGRTKYVG